MKRGALLRCIFWGLIVWLCIGTLEVHAEIASENAFEGAIWEKIIEDSIEGPQGVVQSLCATEDYIIIMENTSDYSDEIDIIKAYYRNDKDADGNPVKKYSLAKRVSSLNYEHSNGMAYNPNTKEIAVALYTSHNPENRGCIFLMDSKTLEYKGKVQIAEDYNILGIGYDLENDRYVIQTNVEGGYSFKILDNQFQIIEDLGNYADTAKGDNFQDLCVSGDYIINFPLTLNMGIGDYIHMYSISQRKMVSDPRLDFHFENVVNDEPESICELEPGVFLAAVNVVYADGRRTICLYKTMVPYNFPVEQPEPEEAEEEQPEGEQEQPEQTEKEQKKQVKLNLEKLNLEKLKKKEGVIHDIDLELTPETMGILAKILKVVIVILIILIIVSVIYMRHINLQRERRRRLERARRERERIRSMYSH